MRRNALVLLLFATSCADPLDLVTLQESVTEHSQTEPLQDDKLSDKHPVYDSTRTLTTTFDGCEVKLNLSGSVTRLSLADLKGDDKPLNGKIFPTRAAAFAALGSRPVLPSMETVNGALKPFNDGLYAAVELSAEDGSGGGLIDKQKLLVDLLQELTTRAMSGASAEQAPAQAASADIAAALLLSGQTPTVSAETLTSAQQLAGNFENDVFRATPIGFYTWTPELATIFQRDRFLQTRHLQTTGDAPSFPALAATALVLNQSTDLRARYEGVLQLYSQLTDPFYDESPIDLGVQVPNAAAVADSATEQTFFAAHPASYSNSSCNTGIAYFPASETVDNRILRPIVCADPPPPSNTNLLDLLIAQIESGAVDLTPQKNSGWYDQQIYALETLLAPDLAPEKDHLLLTSAYKKKLVETFKSILIQTRETHVKQTAVVSDDGTAIVEDPVPFDAHPPLQVEPFPTFYLRTARAYRFVEGVLRATLGDAFVDGTGRLLEDGTRATQTLGEELADKELLLNGLHVVAADSIGAANELSADELAAFPVDMARQRAEQWLASWQNDLDVNRDSRVSLPVAIDGNNATYWAVVGVKVLRMYSTFPDSSRPEIVSAPDCVLNHWVAYQPYMLVEESLELQRPANRAPLTRDAFRKLCDASTTDDEIRTAFESAP